ncbi:MAG TPA: GGDEF domain-containing protein [Verrucomicrobiae bacterium]|nr:GGDEF domain-containing protein [Verrucomicrobiae bacterium]
MSVAEPAQMPDSPYATQLQEGFRKLRFARALEREFQAEFVERHLVRLRLGFAVALAMYSVFTLVRMNAESGVAEEWGLALRIAALGALAFTLVATFIRPVRPALPWLVLATYAVFAAGVTGTEIIAQRYRLAPHYEALFLLSFHVYVFSGLLLRPALVAGGIIVFTYLIGGWAGGLAGKDWVYQVLFIGLTHLLGVTALYSFEHVERDSFLRRRLFGVLATHDSLTGLFNRMAFFQQLERGMRQAARQNVAVGVVLLDIDHFKAYNDRYGHLAGDACLRTVASAIREEFRRPLDACARYGGEEFVGFWYDIQPQSLRSLGDQLRAAVQALRIENEDAPSGRITVSIGAVALVPQEDEPLLELIERADRALYEAKEKGRNRVVVTLLASATVARAKRRKPTLSDAG